MSTHPEARNPTGAPLKKRAAKGAVWLTIEMIGVQATSFAVFAAMAHFIGPRDFGLISISFVAIQSLQILVIYNVATVAARKQRAIELDYTTTFWVTIGLAILAFFALLAVSGWAERLFKAPGLAPVLQAMSVIILFMGLARTHETWLMRHFHFKSLAIRGLVGAVTGGVVGLTMAVKGFGVIALVGQQVATSVVSVILLWAISPWRPSFRFSIPTAVQIFAFLGSVTPNTLVYAVNQNCDTFLVSFFFGPVSAGVFNIGKRVRLTLQLVIGGPINGVALPTLAEIQDDPERLRRGVLSSLMLICVLSSPVFLGVSAVAHEAVSVIFGQKWMDAVPVLKLLSFSGFAMVVLAYNDNIFILKNRPLWCLYISLTYTLLAIAAVFFCAEMKIDSLALPFVLPYVIVFPLSAMLVSKCLSISPREWIGAMLPGVGSATAMFIVVLLAGRNISGFGDLARLGILCSIGAAFYLVVIWSIWRDGTKMVIDMLRHMIHK